MAIRTDKKIKTVLFTGAKCEIVDAGTILYNPSVRPFLKEHNSISAESNSIKETKIHRWASSVKSRGLDSKALEWLELFFPLMRKIF